MDGMQDLTATVAARPDFEVFKRYARQGNTAMLLERLAPTQGYRPPRPDQPNAPHGTYNGRPIIGSGARIDGGVYLGRKPREAIVVDSRGAQGQLARVYHDLVNRVHGEVEAGLGATAVSTSAFLREARRWFRTHLLTLLADLIRREMPYDEAVVRDVAVIRALRPDDEVELDIYVTARGGVCRHQVCLLGLVLELAVRDGWLVGEVHLDRKHVPGYFSHAWVRFVDPYGDVLILDPAQGLFTRWAELDELGRHFYGRELAPNAQH
jgi:hypothetical protein